MLTWLLGFYLIVGLILFLPELSLPFKLIVSGCQKYVGVGFKYRK